MWRILWAGLRDAKRALSIFIFALILPMTAATLLLGSSDALRSSLSLVGSLMMFYVPSLIFQMTNKSNVKHKRLRTLASLPISSRDLAVSRYLAPIGAQLLLAAVVLVATVLTASAGTTAQRLVIVANCALFGLCALALSLILIHVFPALEALAGTIVIIGVSALTRNSGVERLMLPLVQTSTLGLAVVAFVAVVILDITLFTRRSSLV